MNTFDKMPSNVNTSFFVVMQPKQFEEMPQAIQALLEHKSVVLNLTRMDPREAQRAVDFVTGGTYSLLGHQLQTRGKSLPVYAERS